MGRDMCMFSRVNEEADVVWFKIAYKNTLYSEADITTYFADKGLDIHFAYFDSSEDSSRVKYVIFTEVDKSRNIDDIAGEPGKWKVGDFIEQVLSN